MSTEELVTPALPKGFLRSCLLLLLRADPAHGYELIERATNLGFDRSDAGGLYRALRRLEQGGLVHSAWEPSEAGPDRRIYEITRAGMEELHARARALEASAAQIHRFLSRYEEFVSLRGAEAAPGPAAQRGVH